MSNTSLSKSCQTKNPSNYLVTKGQIFEHGFKSFDNLSFCTRSIFHSWQWTVQNDQQEFHQIHSQSLYEQFEKKFIYK